MQKNMLFKKDIVIHMKLNYLLHLPEVYYDDQLKWPLILFLHGSGEIGNDLNLLRVQGLPKVVEKDRNFPFIVLSPQCPEDSSWHDEFGVLDELVKHVMDDYHVNPNHIYLTGVSMGGYAAWDYAVVNPNTFAAVVPICGGSSYLEHLDLIKHIPVWAFHGALDDIVPVQESEKAVEALRAVGGNVKLTIYPDAGHDSWSTTYDNPDLFKWLLQHSKCNNVQAFK